MVTVNTGNVAAAGVLGAVFLVLKLAGHLGWPWWYVTAPYTIPAIVVFLVGIASFAQERP